VLLGIGLVVALAVPCATSHAQSSPGAKALEARLYAPCCYGGTLDSHESDLAHTLREEIETRMERGESGDSVQADLVARYGAKILAARSDAPIRAMGIVLTALAVLAAAGLVVVVRRWTLRSRRALAAAAPPGTSRDELDGRIDAELADLDT
jgi:cytochrome c-type biogenesis protein CcmH